MLINYKTLKTVNAYIKAPVASLLISTNEDIDTGILIAKYIHGKLDHENMSPIIIIRDTPESPMGIDTIRELKKGLYLQANPGSKISRVIVIIKPEKLKREAQSSMLKLAEQLPDRTLLFLISASEERILDTIKSRCFNINLHPILLDEAVKYASSKNIDKLQIKKAYQISNGNASTFKKILFKEMAQIAEYLNISKKFILSSVFDRQQISKDITSKKSIAVQDFMKYLLLLSKTGMHNSKTNKEVLRWKNNLTTILHTQKLLSSNVSPKLAILYLSIKLD